MSKILVDSSVWIQFFKGSEDGKILFPLLDSNQICTNDLILAELIPSLNQKKEPILVGLLKALERLKIVIDWDEIVLMQTRNLKHGINRVGISDLLIAQNAIQNSTRLLSFDKHFELMRHLAGLKTLELK